MGTFSSGIFGNDDAQDFLEELGETSSQFDYASGVVDELKGFLERHSLGLAPRPMTKDERDEIIIQFENGARSSNPHLPAESVEALIESFRGSFENDECAMTDTGEEEVRRVVALAGLLVGEAGLRNKNDKKYLTAKSLGKLLDLSESVYSVLSKVFNKPALIVNLEKPYVRDVKCLLPFLNPEAKE